MGMWVAFRVPEAGLVGAASLAAAPPPGAPALCNWAEHRGSPFSLGDTTTAPAVQPGT